MKRSISSILFIALTILLIIAVVPIAAQNEQVMTAGFGVGPGGDEDGRPWTGGAGTYHTY